MSTNISGDTAASATVNDGGDPVASEGGDAEAGGTGSVRNGGYTSSSVVEVSRVIADVRRRLSAIKVSTCTHMQRVLLCLCGHFYTVHPLATTNALCQRTVFVVWRLNMRVSFV